MNSHGWTKLLLQMDAKASIAIEWGPVFASVVKPESFSSGQDEIDDFLGQIMHESAGLTRMSENLNYSAQRLMQVWPSRFKTLEDAVTCAHDPEKLANRVYGDRMGNDNPGDGWLYRGRGPIQLTGKNNYRHVGNLIGQDLVGIPDLAAQPHFALEIAIAWWEDSVPDSMLGDPSKVRQHVNNSLRGLAEVEHLAALARAEFARA